MVDLILTEAEIYFVPWETHYGFTQTSLMHVTWQVLYPSCTE